LFRKDAEKPSLHLVHKELSDCFRRIFKGVYRCHLPSKNKRRDIGLYILVMSLVVFHPPPIKAGRGKYSLITTIIIKEIHPSTTMLLDSQGDIQDESETSINNAVRSVNW
ncbi:hypothetical protein J6590_099281, partial [Homalodisca vitripennis]